MRNVLTTCLALALLTLTSQAQSYSIDWSTIDGGGGTSTGGVYAVSGTLGQPDAGGMSGGNFSLTGGFWNVIAVQTPGAPLLTISFNAQLATATLSWPLSATGFVLDQTGPLVPPPGINSWSPVAASYQTNATHIFLSVPASGGPKFYRLTKP